MHVIEKENTNLFGCVSCKAIKKKKKKLHVICKGKHKLIYCLYLVKLIYCL